MNTNIKKVFIGENVYACYNKNMRQVKIKKLSKNNGNILIKDIEREFSVDFGVRSDMTAISYLKQIGLPSLAKVLEKVSK